MIIQPDGKKTNFMKNESAFYSVGAALVAAPNVVAKQMSPKNHIRVTLVVATNVHNDNFIK